MEARDLYSTKRAPAIEQIAAVEGESNFISLLAGIEAGPDTTQIMGTLAFTRSAGAIPEVLEAHFAKSVLYKLPLMSMVFMLLVRQLAPKERDWPWMQGAVADAFMLLRDGHCAGVKVRARKFRVDENAYSTVRKIAEGILWEVLAKARAAYYRAKRSTTDAPGIRHTENERGTTFQEMALIGCYRQAPLPLSDGSDDPYSDDDREPYAAIPPGMRDRLGYDARHDQPGPVLTLYGEEAEAHCRAFPGQTKKRPYSL